MCFYGAQVRYATNSLNLVLLTPDIPCLHKQCRSRSVSFFRTLIWIYTVIKYVNLYQQLGSSNLIGLKRSGCGILIYSVWQGLYHYENTSIQIHWKFYHQKMAIFHIKYSDIFHISAQNIDCGYSLELPRLMILSRNNKNNVYPCEPQFYYIKVGFKGVSII